MQPQHNAVLNQKTHNQTLFSSIIGPFAVIAVPIVFFIAVLIWPESFARQFAAAAAAACLAFFAIQRQKYQALLIGTIFLSQFYLSLHSFDLHPPVKFQIFLSDVVLAAITLAALEKKIRLRLDSIGWLFLSLLLWSLIAAFTSAHIHRSFIFLFGQFKFLLLYLVVMNTDISDKGASRFITAVLAVVIIQSAIAGAQLANGGPIGLQIIGEIPSEKIDGYKVLGSLRVSGTIAGTNAFAGYMAMLLVFLLPFVFARRTIFMFFGFSLGCIGLILSLSRAGWLSFFIGSLFVIIIMVRSGLIQMTRLLMILILGTVVISIGISVYYEKIMDRFQSREAIQSATGRWTQVASAVDVIKKYPLTGIGPGITEFFGRWNDHRKYVKKSLPDVDLANQVHNSQLQVAIESGIPGLFLFLLIMLLVLRSVFRSIRMNARDSNWALLRIGGNCAAVAVLVHTSFGTELNNTQIFFAFWTLLGLARNRNILDDKAVSNSSTGESALQLSTGMK